MPSRPQKRNKNDAKAKAAEEPKPVAALPQSRLFAPFRALGYVSDHVPFSMFVHTPKGALAKPTIHIVTSVGRSWLMWDAERMTLLFAGELDGVTAELTLQDLMLVRRSRGWRRREQKCSLPLARESSSITVARRLRLIQRRTGRHSARS